MRSLKIPPQCSVVALRGTIICVMACSLLTATCFITLNTLNLTDRLLRSQACFLQEEGPRKNAWGTTYSSQVNKYSPYSPHHTHTDTLTANLAAFINFSILEWFYLKQNPLHTHSFQTVSTGEVCSDSKGLYGYILWLGCIYCPQKTCFYSFTCQNISCIVLMKGYCIILNLCLNVLHVAYPAVNTPLKT